MELFLFTCISFITGGGLTYLVLRNQSLVEETTKIYTEISKIKSFFLNFGEKDKK